MQAPPPELCEALRSATRIVALTGSGISAESGVPTFREAQTGLWAEFDPQQLATPEAFASHPRRGWEWYEWRRELVSAARPNPAHLALADWARRAPGFSVITQNVDGLHQRAGSPSVIEFHGNILRTRCSKDGELVDEWPATNQIPPLCPRCGALLRPDVVWFGEAIPHDALEAAARALDHCDVLLSIGTSSLVYPAAGLAEAALAAGVTVVEINPGATPLSSDADFVLREPAGEALPRLLAALM